MEAALQALLDKEACRDLVRHYARGLDRGDLVLLQSLFWPDARLDHAEHFSGTAHDFCVHAVEFLTRFPRLFHMIGHHIVEVHGDVAVGESYGFSAHHAGDDPGFEAIVCARLLDRYERREGTWKIAARRTIIQLGLDIDSSREWSRGELGPPPATADYGGRAPDDPVYAWFGAARPLGA